MNIRKETELTPFGTPSSEQLEKINAYAPSALSAEEVFVFSLRLCDDQPDRDDERFDTDALPRLAELFLGKTGITDHNWSAEKQVARIFDTEVCRENGVSSIKAWAYALRAGNDAFVRDIEGGIKKEVSVGCAMAWARCSICGERYGSCAHEKGQFYDGKRCVAILCEPVDAYEFSFVAVPAQRQAGVLKGWKGGESMHLKELAAKGGEEARRELAALELAAALGRDYAAQLKKELIRLSAALGFSVRPPVLGAIADRLTPDELRAVHQALTEKAAEAYGPVTQLPGDLPDGEPKLETDYLI